MQASDAHPKASDGHPKASDGRTKAANGQFICTAKKLSQCFIEKEYLLYEKRQSTSRRLKTARPTSQSRFSQMTKAALPMTESTHKEDRSLLYNRPKATWRTAESHQEDDRKPPRGRQIATVRMTEAYHENNRKPPRGQQEATTRTTESHHAAIKNKLRDGPHRAALFTLYFSLFTSKGETRLLTPFCYPTSPPSSAAHTVPGWL